MNREEVLALIDQRIKKEGHGWYENHTERGNKRKQKRRAKPENTKPCKVRQKTIDTMLGKRFGQLTTYEYLGDSYWRCRCTCGNPNYVVRGDSLKNGNTKSCGCLRSKNAGRPKYTTGDRKDLTGRKYGKLTVDGFDTHHKLWSCTCECGMPKVGATYKQLASGDITQCSMCQDECEQAELEKAANAIDNRS